MSRNLLPLLAAVAVLAGTAHADTPQVAVDVAPVHSLVARVMEGVGAPTLIVSPGASPHEYSLRPSEAGALQNADLVFWIGPDLTPWLQDALGTLAENATVIELIEVEGTLTLPVRESALFEPHEHGHHEKDRSGHENHEAHDMHDHEEHDHTEKGDHADHAAADHGHTHGAYDPHVWLSPDNAANWLTAIATALSAADPDNAGRYKANATAGQRELGDLQTEIGDLLQPHRNANFIVFHDAYQYFEVVFDIPAAGAISVSAAADPSPARIAEIQATVREQGVTCVLSEPQFAPGIVKAVMDGIETNTGVLDPLGSDLEPGPALYPQMLRNLAKALADCL